MPEGPEIRRAADRLRDALQGELARQVWFGLPQLKPFEAQLSEAVVEGVESRGKAMLILFDNQLILYSHNQLYGRWYTLPAGQYPQTRRSLWRAATASKRPVSCCSGEPAAPATAAERQ